MRFGALLLLGLASLVAAAQTNPLSRTLPPPSSLANGRWNGVDLERRTNCSNAQNNGTRGTYAQFDVESDATGIFLIGQTGITGLNCTYTGHTQPGTGGLSVSGTYSCTDGKQGTFRSNAIDVNGNTLTAQMTVQLTGGESCAIDKILSMARFYP